MAAAIAGDDVLVLMPTGGAAALGLQEMHSQRHLHLLATSNQHVCTCAGDESAGRSGWGMRGHSR